MKIIQKILSLFSFFPLTILILAYRYYKDWKPAFIISGIVVVIYLLKILYERKKVEPFILAINCFLIGGAAMYIFNIGWLQYIYGEFTYTTIFLWSILVGLILTFFTSQGFVTIDHPDEKITKRFSILLLLLCFVVLGISWYFKGDFLMSAYVPFVSLIFFRDILNSFPDYSLFKIRFFFFEFLFIVGAAFLKKYGFGSLIVVLVGKKILRGFVLDK